MPIGKVKPTKAPAVPTPAAAPKKAEKKDESANDAASKAKAKVEADTLKAARDKAPAKGAGAGKKTGGKK